jgi:hypothetical protein
VPRARYIFFRAHPSDLHPPMRLHFLLCIIFQNGSTSQRPSLRSWGTFYTQTIANIRAGETPQKVECLPSKCEALSSTPVLPISKF